MTNNGSKFSLTETNIVDLKGLKMKELVEFVADMGEQPYRGRQLWSWIHEQKADSFAVMTDLPIGFRNRLAECATVKLMEQREFCKSSTGMAAKFLFDVPGGGLIEAVYISDGKRRTACLSSQVGCPLDCKFCATGKMGFFSNLTAAQIVDQLLRLQRYADGQGERVSNIVMMGMGEPLLNYDQVTLALRIIRSQESGIGGRRITVSTAGYIPGIRRLAREDEINVGLAISLNATTDETRTRLMPINRKFPLSELVTAAREFYERRGRRVTFEYVLMQDITDGDDDAVRLAALTNDFPCKINVIPYNECIEAFVGKIEFKRPSKHRIKAFADILKKNTYATVTIRDSRGRDINAACGQLYRRVMKKSATDAKS